MYYRTKTYLAGDWDGDRDAIDKIHEWNGSDYYSLFDFVDVHEFVQARDDSLPCSIKRSLAERMRMCKNFLIIVGGTHQEPDKRGLSPLQKVLLRLWRLL